LYHGDQGQAPRGDLYRSAALGREILEELVVIDGAKLGAQINVEIAFGKSGFDHGCGGGQELGVRAQSDRSWDTSLLGRKRIVGFHDRL
jgi:hypothetical protein